MIVDAGKQTPGDRHQYIAGHDRDIARAQGMGVSRKDLRSTGRGDLERSEPEGMKRGLYLLFLVPVCLLSVLTGMYLFSRTEPVFLLKNIKIKGASQLQESEILTKIYPYLKSSIFATDMGKVKEAITAHPFIKDVTGKEGLPLFDPHRRQRAHPFGPVGGIGRGYPGAGRGRIAVQDPHEGKHERPVRHKRGGKKRCPEYLQGSLRAGTGTASCRRTPSLR